MTINCRWNLWALVIGFALTAGVSAADPIPHAQDKPPGPALTPAEAIAKMKVPEGFTVELVASEPDLVNPIGMTFDEKGRIWVTESLEYPRRDSGPGKDRVKILEDTDNNGSVDKVSIFADGLNIPSGVAVGHGGVWVANAPDILFYPDADGDGVADGKPTVVVTGFGRTDTHELPNSLTWGPDGWLYGLNGVFNHSHVFYTKDSPHFREEHPGWKFTVALFRIHPVTREFQVFCEGTSNPWGVAFDGEGSCFISACVIDHLWHLVETGYYHRQGGPYPPFTWKIESIVKHKHQKAAYCGIHYFDSDAYPEQYRQKLYMGNIHGGCINVDKVQRNGSTYFGTLEPDFLTANDAWFMPVVQKTGPDGSLYVLDWYDRYHCYQDANRDPAGIDRLKGRLYRVRYKDTPRVKIDLPKESDKELVAKLDAGNDLIRGLAQRLLTERLFASKGDSETSKSLTQLALDSKTPRRQRLHALWTTANSSGLNDETLAKLLADEDAMFRGWAVRAAGNQGKVSDANRAKIVSLANDPSLDVKLQVAIASKKVAGIDAIPTLLQVLQGAKDDVLIPRVVWQNLHPLLESDGAKFAGAITDELAKSPAVAQVLSRAIDRILAVKTADPAALAGLFRVVTSNPGQNQDAGRTCLQTLAARVQNRELIGAQLAGLQAKLEQPLDAILANEKHPLRLEAALLAASWKNPTALAEMLRLATDSKRPDQARLAAVEALVSAQDANAATTVVALLKDVKQNSATFRGQLLATAGRLEGESVATTVLENFASLEPELKPRAVEFLSQRVSWGKKLLSEVAAGKIAATLINVNQAQKLNSFGNEQLNALLAKHWGTVRTTRDPKREEFIGEMRKLVRSKKGDPVAGMAAFNKVCGQCHKIHGQGQEVGPDITSNGRSSFEQLLSNTFDPSLVIGASYQARTVVTDDGRVLTGLLVEDSPQRVVLKMQGGKLETIPRDAVEKLKVSELSMMPEGVEKQLQPQEIIDLFAFLTLDKPPSDPAARLIPGTIPPTPREEGNPKKFGQLIESVLPGYHTEASGIGGIAILPEHFGRENVLRTHPVERDKACVLTRTIDLPAGKKSRLLLSAGHHAQGNWELIVKGNGKELFKGLIDPKTAAAGWREVTVDLSSLAGQTVKLELHNFPNDWAFEFAYWSRAEVVSE